MKNDDFAFVKADKDLFAVYQTIYSGEDLELWFDWKSRLEDTKWTDNCYWIICNDVKIAGAIINDNTVMYPFLVSPFCDRTLFWRVLHKHIIEAGYHEIHTNGVFDDDVNILLTLGYKIDRIRQMMCRPTDCFTMNISSNYKYRIPEMKDVDIIAEAELDSYKGGIDYKVFGEATFDDTKKDVIRFINLFTESDTISNSIIVLDKATDKIAGLCLSGVNNDMPNRFAEILDICVLPSYRNQGLAEFMLKYAITKSYPRTPVIKLCVTVGNSSESLYRKMGFVAGSKFTNMSYQP